MNGSEDVNQRLEISISADAESAVAGLSAVDAAAAKSAESIAAANQKLATSAGQTREQLAAAARGTTEAAQTAKAGFEQIGQAAAASQAQVHTATQEVARLHAAFADSEKSAREFEASTGAVGVREIESAAARARELLVTAKRELEAIRDDNRALTAGRPVSSTLDDQIRATRGVQTAATLRPGGPAYMRTELQAGNVEGSPDLQARYRIYEQANRQIQELENQQTAAITRAEAEQTQAAVAGVRARIQAMNDEVRFGHTSLEERKSQLGEMLAAYKGNAEAISLIERESVKATLAHNQERRKSMSEAHSAIADTVLNSGYLLPGEVGNAVTNLGYMSKGGPAALAVGGAAVAGIGAATGIASLANIAGKDEEALNKLGISVRNQGGNWDALRKSVEEYIDVQGKTTTFGREEVVPGLNEFVVAGLSAENAMKVLRVAEDLATAQGVPLETAVKALAGAYEGNNRGLVQLHILNKEQVADHIEFGDVLVKAKEKTHGQATAIDSYAKQQIMLKNAMHEAASAAGEDFLPVMDKLAHVMVTFFQDMNTKDAFKNFADGLGNAVDGAIKLERALRPIDSFLHTVADKAVGPAIAALFHPGNGGDDMGMGALAADRAGNRPQGGAQRTPQGSMNLDQIRDLWLRAGGNPQAADLMSHVAYAESAGNPNIKGPGYWDSGKHYDTYGLWQVSTVHGNANYRDPMTNAREAVDLYKAHPNLSDWEDSRNKGAGGGWGQYAGSNSAPSDADLRAIKGAAGFGSTATKDLSALKDQYFKEQQAGLPDARMDYENALKTIISDNTKTMQERVAAEQRYASLVKQDEADTKRAASEATKEERERQKAVETAMKSEIARDELTRRRGGNTQAAYAAEIAAVTKLRDQRGSANDADSTKDVDALNAKIQSLIEGSHRAWTTTFDEAKAHFKASSESLDEYLGKLERLKRGATVDEKARVSAEEKAAVERDATGLVKSLQAGITSALQRGASRPEMERLYGEDIAKVTGRKNYQDPTVADAYSAFIDKTSQASRSDQTKDAKDAVAELDRQYKELGVDINSTTKAAGDSNVETIRMAQQQQRALDAPIERDRAILAGTEAQIAAVRRLRDEYSKVPEAVDFLNGKLDTLTVTQHDTNDKIVQDERAALQARTDEYQKFADSATSNMAKIWTNGKSAMDNFRDIFKTTIGDLEQQMLKSAFSQAFFGGAGAGDVNIRDSLQRTMFGGVAPVKPGDSPAMIALEKKINESPRGTASDMLHVVLHGDPALGTGGGGSSLANAAARAVTDLASGNIAGAVGDVGAAAVGKSFSVSTSFNGAGAQVWDAGTSFVPGGGPGPQGAWGNYAQVPIAGLPPIDYGMYGGQAGSSNQYADASNYTAVSPNGSGSGGSGARGGGALARDLSYAQGVYSLYQGLTRGGTAGETLSGVGGIVGTALGGPLGGFLGSTAGNLLGSVFGPHWGPASNYPDRSDTQRYGQIMADLYGTNSSNGQSFTKDQSTADLFFKGTTNGAGAAGVERLLAGGQASYTAQTGRTAAQYAQDLAMFGQDANALGTGGLYTPGSHIGTLESRAAGAKGSYSYTDYGSALAAIEQGLSTNQGGLGAFNTYSLRRALPDYNLALMSGGTAVQQALQTGTGPVAAAAAAAASNAAAKTNPVGANEPRVVVNAQNSTFVGADGISGLTDLITTALARKQHGTLPNPTANRRVLNV